MSGWVTSEFADRMAMAAQHPAFRAPRGWWRARAMREQVLIGILAALAILAALLALVVAPLRAAREADVARIRVAQMIEARVHAGGDAVPTAMMRPASASASASVSSIVTNSAAAAHLAIQRIEPEGGNTRIVLADAPFADVIRWVVDLERNSRLRVQAASIDRKDAPGIVSASFVVAG